MGEIRTFEESHISDVAALELKFLRRQDRRPGRDLEDYFRKVFLDHPWRALNVSSKVYVHEGNVVGFMGLVPRPMVWRGRPVVAATLSQFVVDRRYRGSPGLEMLQDLFDGPQDLCLVDGATEPAFTAWTGMGAPAAWLYSFEWTRILRPAAYTAGLLKQSGGRAAKTGSGLSLLSPAGDQVLTRLPFRRFQAPRSTLKRQTATAEELLEAMSEIGWKEKLRPEYEPAAFRWLLNEAAQARFHGTLRMLVVRDGQGARVGWCVYYVQPQGVCMVLQLGAKTRQIEDVLAAIFEDAWEHGAAAVRGRAIPRFLTQFHNQHCAFHHPGSGVLVHSKQPELLLDILRGDAFLSLLDGEWWQRFATENWN